MTDIADGSTNMSIESLQEPMGRGNAMGTSGTDLHMRSSRRPRHQSAQSAWEQPFSIPSLGSTTSTHYKPLYDIAFCLRRLDLCVPRVITKALESRDRSLFGRSDYSHYEDLLPEELEEKLGSHPGYYEGHEPEEQKLKSYVEGLSIRQVRDCIRDTRTLPYLSRLFIQMTSLNQSARARQLVIDSSRDFTIASDFIEQHGEGVSKSEYADYCIKQFNQTLIEVRFLYNVTLELRDHVREAASNNLLDTLSLEQVKLKLSAIQDPFRETCGELRKPVERLLYDTDTWWAEPTSPVSDQDPKNVSTAYQTSPGVNSTISFLVPVSSLVSSIPLYLAWTYSTHDPGSYLDADFYQLLSNSLMQLLSILTMIIPIVYHVRLAKLSWFWTWVLASASAICAIIAIPLYLYIPTEWSMLLSFVASVGQSFVILQLIFAL